MSNQEPDQEADIRKLVEMAGRRSDLPEDDLAAITAAARATWRQQVREEPSYSRRRWPLALAAVLITAIGAALWWGGLGTVEQASPPVVVAEAQRVWGTASLEGSEGGTAVAEGQAFTADSRISTIKPGSPNSSTPNRIAVLLQGGTSLRLDQGTRVRLISATDLELEAGAVYIDTGLEDRPAVTVHTPYGTVTDIGTQFSVRLPEGEAEESTPEEVTPENPLRVRVREGEVQVDAAEDGSHAVLAGTELLLTAHGAGSRRQIPIYGPEWDWILDTAPRFQVEGMTLADFLAWVTRETGWAVRIDDPSLAAAAEATVLHGTTGSLRPDRAALAALAGAGFHGEVQDGTLILSRAGS